MILSKKPWFNQLTFTLIGRGEMFSEITKPLSKFSNVKLKETFLRQDEIAEYYKKNGIVLIPTRGDTQGVSRDEAMSCGLVPITNAVAAIPEFVDENCGILAPADDAQAIADGIERLYNDPELFLQMSKNAAARVRSQTSKEYTIYKELYIICGRKCLQNEESKNISIFGSCVSRDVFRISPSLEINLKSYIARQSVVSSVSKPISINYNDIQLNSEFQKKAVFNDFNKNTFDILKSDESKWLMIDFIDERLSVVGIDDSYITKSVEAVNSKCIPENSNECKFVFDGKEYYRGKACVSKYLRKFCECIREIYDTDHIIIHRAKCVTNYISKDGNICSYSEEKVEFANNINKFLDFMYDILVEEFPDAYVIDCMSETLGSENHTWGLGIVHYEDQYYKKVMKILKEIFDINS